MLQGLIFDLDGTLADTLPLCVRAFQAVVLRHSGRRLSDAEVRAQFGPTDRGILRRLLGPTGGDAAMADYLVEYERGHATCRAPFAGIRAVLATVRARGARLGLVTGKGPETAAITLRLLELEDFDAVATGSDAGAIKPRCIRRMCEQWRLAPAAVAYAGDTPYDITAAKEVGAVAVAAAWAPGTDADALAARGPDHWFGAVEAFAAWIDQVVSA